MSPVEFSKHYHISSRLDKTILVVTVKLDDMLHAYAEGEKIGKPVRLTIKHTGGFKELGKAIIPVGAKKTLPAPCLT